MGQSDLTKKSYPSIGKILVVDDVPENLRILLELLKRAGFEVLTAINGAIALEAVERIQPDLILLDIILPDLSGYEVCRRLKAVPATAEIPILFISGLGDSIGKLQAFSVGGVDYICKPFNSEEVLARVKTHLDLRRAVQTVQLQKKQVGTGKV